MHSPCAILCLLSSLYFDHCNSLLKLIYANYMIFSCSWCVTKQMLRTKVRVIFDGIKPDDRSAYSGPPRKFQWHVCYFRWLAVGSLDNAGLVLPAEAVEGLCRFLWRHHSVVSLPTGSNLNCSCVLINCVIQQQAIDLSIDWLDDNQLSVWNRLKKNALNSLGCDVTTWPWPCCLLNLPRQSNARSVDTWHKDHVIYNDVMSQLPANIMIWWINLRPALAIYIYIYIYIYIHTYNIVFINNTVARQLVNHSLGDGQPLVHSCLIINNELAGYSEPRD